MLERHPDISYAGEVLDPSSELRPFSGWLAERGFDRLSLIDVSARFLEFVDELKNETHINIVDIKYNCLAAVTPSFHSFCDTPWVLQIMSLIPVPMIHLRRSHLDTYVSAKLAERAGIFHATGSIVPPGQLHVDTSDLAEYLRICSDEDRFFEKFFQGYRFSYSTDYEVCFEDNGRVSADVMDGISRLLNLDMGGVDTMPRFVRQAPGSLAERISNLEEVTAWLGRHGEFRA
ncbi:hypothetical protein [Novosphingobium sp.]|uniref:hypothetical protein n=1 Tax=Novosphingobium sp. TaxID=1874826 RepID=UPI0026364C4C|nr:hypothetical protein [Novosphingobium sp.]